MKLKTAWIAVTYNCNNKCSWCYAGSNKVACEKSMNLEFAEQSLDLLKHLGVKNAIFIGGEPTVYPNLAEVIEKSMKRGLKTGIVSNGRRLSNRHYLSSLKRAGLESVTISIEGSNAKIHDKATQVEGSFDESVNGLENCLRENIYTITETTIAKDNRHDMLNMVDLFHGLGLKRIGFNVCGLSFQEMKDTSHILSPIEGAKAIEEIYLYGREMGIEVVSISPLPICNLEKNVADEMVDRGLLRGSCQMFSGVNFVIDYNGDILTCVHFTGYPLMNISKNGRIKTAGEFMEEYTNPDKTPSKFRDKIWKYPSVKCQDSGEFGKKCMGGCPIFWFAYNPEECIRGIEVDT